MHTPISQDIWCFVTVTSLTTTLYGVTTDKWEMVYAHAQYLQVVSCVLNHTNDNKLRNSTEKSYFYICCPVCSGIEPILKSLASL